MAALTFNGRLINIADARISELFKVVTNSEYLYAITDNSDTFLFGIKKDGSLNWAKGLPEFLKDLIGTKVDKEDGKSLIDSLFAESVSYTSNEEYLFALLDNESNVLFGIQKDGSISWNKGVPTPILDALAGKVSKVDGKSLIDAEFAKTVHVENNEEYIFAITDADNTLLWGIRKDGSLEWNGDMPSVFMDALSKKVDKKQGFGLVSNQVINNVVFKTDYPYVFAIYDSADTFLFGIQQDGSVEWSKGLPVVILDALKGKQDAIAGKTLVDSQFANGIHVVSNAEYVFAIVDANDRFLFGIEHDGTVDWPKGLPQVCIDALDTKQDKIQGKTLIDNAVANHSSSDANREFYWALLDTEDRVVEYIKPTGEHGFRLPLNLDGGVNWTKENLDELSKALKDNGFTGGTGDWSDKESLEIPIPEMAIINFSNISQMPQTKTTDAHAIMEFWDMNGNYFKKNVIANAQGSSSMKWPKKNIGIDICNDEWIGDDTFKIKFGEWVAQDSFHIKAYATDYFRCVALAGYDFVKQIADTRTLNTTWKQAINYSTTDYVGVNSVSPQNDSGALCFPQGFPCKVYLNGKFEGLFCWQLKKHRDNYNMDKKDTKNIHIEGMITQTNFWNGTNIAWTEFEVRNPKDLINYDGTKYDGDNPQELIDSTSPAYDSTNKKHVNTAKVKQYIINLAGRMNEIGNDKNLFETYFGLDSCIDYAVFTDAIYNYDYAKNIQWTTWDGVKWYVNPYDLDCTLGANSSADSIHYPTTYHTIQATNHPLTFVVNNYTTELEARWAELRNKGIIDPLSIGGLIEHYVRLFGNSGYKDEYAKWTDNPCNRDPVFDTENWDLEVDADGNPVIYTAAYHTWDSTTNYATGYVVQYNPSSYSEGWYFRFTAKQPNVNCKPVITLGFRDNIFRVYNWLAKQISNMDNLYNYN